MSTVRLPSTCIVGSAPKSLKTSSFVKTPDSLGFMSTSKTFGLKANSGFRASSMAAYKIKLVTPEGVEHEFEAPDDICLLESAENAGVELPYSCRAGSCSTCCGKLTSGSIDQSEGSFLDEDQMKDGYVLTCVAYPAADCVIHTHKESDLF